MQTVTIDLQQIPDREAFYSEFARQFALRGFGDNLDALWDMLTAGIPLPLRIILLHLNDHPQRAELESLVAVMREAELETGGAFSIRVRTHARRGLTPDQG